MCSAVLGSALASHITLLHTLNIGENYIDDRGATSLAEALKTNRTLTTLNVRGAALRRACSEEDAAAQGLPTVWGPAQLALGPGLFSIGSLFWAARSLPADNGVSDAGAAALGEVFRTNTSLRSLDLSSAVAAQLVTPLPQVEVPAQVLSTSALRSVRR